MAQQTWRLVGFHSAAGTPAEVNKGCGFKYKQLNMNKYEQLISNNPTNKTINMTSTC